MTLTAELRALALRCAAALDPDVMTGGQAADAVRELATVEKAAATARMFLALRVAKTNAWQGHGHKTAADWLAAQLGISVWEANKQLGTARKASDLPRTKKKMQDGELSPDQADAVTDAAAADPSAEDDLLDLAAKETTRNLRDEAAKRKAAATDTEARDKRIHRERSKRAWIDRDGAWNLRLRGTAADGARFEAAERPFVEQAFRTGRSDGVRDTFENREYDAVMAMCGIRPLPGTEVEPVAPASGPVKRPGGSNVKVIVRIDHTAFLRGTTVAGETCEVAGLGPVSVDTVKDLMDDAFLAAVVTKGRDVVNVAHLGRRPSSAPRWRPPASPARTSAATAPSTSRSTTAPLTRRTPRPASPTSIRSAPATAAATTSRPTMGTSSNRAPAADASCPRTTSTTPAPGPGPRSKATRVHRSRSSNPPAADPDPAAAPFHTAPDEHG